ncbi:MAG: 50S ribosomal protein L6 [Candidatus Xiphinematobacter sp.]|nr:MAG: 50S ribosomal protein L6 [Candidatus Xiphinematobacter sp.]
MSRLGKKPIKLPLGVSVVFLPDGGVAIKGPKGGLVQVLPPAIRALVKECELLVERKDNSRRSRAMHGLTRTLLSNMVLGVSSGFRRELEIHGVGFRATVQEKVLNLNLGFSRPVLFPIPENIQITVVDNTKLTIEGIDNQLVGQCAADIRRCYPPEPFKGKGIRLKGEQIRRKEGKTVQ